MSRPVYIICCESAVEDKNTNRLSLQNVLEKVVMHMGGRQMPTGRPFSNSFNCDIVAVWQKEEGEDGEEFEHRLVFTSPDGEEISTGHKQIVFSEDPDKYLQRIRVQLVGIPPARESGLLMIRSQLRRVGTDQWVSQEFPLMIERYEPAHTDVQQAEDSGQSE